MPVSQRLYLVDTKTDDKILFAEASDDGWLPIQSGKYWLWLAGRDVEASLGIKPTTLVLKTEGVND